MRYNGEGGRRVGLKCTHVWQGVFDRHWGMCERGEWGAAREVVRGWTREMEEGGTEGGGRRVRLARAVPLGWGGGRERERVGCAIM